MHRASQRTALMVGAATLLGLAALTHYEVLSFDLALPLATAVVVVFYGLASGPTLRSVLLRVLMALLPILFVALLVIVYVILPNETLKSLNLQAAAIAGTVIASGWLATFVAAEYKRADERETTRIDTLNALETEIFSVIEKLDFEDIEAAGEIVQRRIAAGGDQPAAPGAPETRYFPFAATESPPTVFEALSDKIVVFEPRTLQIVLRFYAAYSDLRAMADDHRSPELRDLSAERRVGAHKVLTEHRVATFYWGIRALVRVNAALSRPKDTTRAERFTNKKIAEKAIEHQRRKET